MTSFFSGRNSEWWTAAGTVGNVVVVFALAVINVAYAIFAKRQSEATLEQAKATEQQTSAAMKNIELIEQQMRDQEMLKRTETIIYLRRLVARLRWWSPKLEGSWGQLPPFEGFLPDNWASIVFVLERTLPERKNDLVGVQVKIENAENLVTTELKKPTNYQYGDVFKVASHDLLEALRPLGEMLSTLENQQLS